MTDGIENGIVNPYVIILSPANLPEEMMYGVFQSNVEQAQK